MILFLSTLGLILCAGALWYLYQGPLYVPSLRRTVEQMVRVSEVRPGMKTVDLGSGDGRVVVAMAEAGANAYGYEINPVLANLSRRKIAKLNLGNRARILTNNFWNQSLDGYDVVTVFGIGHVMDRLSRKLASELKPGALVVSNAFEIRGLGTPKQIGSLLVYRK